MEESDLVWRRTYALVRMPLAREGGAPDSEEGTSEEREQ